MATTTVDLKVEGMTCQGCVRSVEKKLSSVAGVQSAHVNLAAGTASVAMDAGLADEAKLIGAVEQIGFHASRI
jgi:copper chaperone